MIATEWGSDRSKRAIEGKGNTFMKLAADGNELQGGVMAHALRSIGFVGLLRALSGADFRPGYRSAALNYAYVAGGQLDLYWEIGCWS